MLDVSQDIIAEQVKLEDKKVVFSVAIHDYEFPVKPTALRPDYLNWRPIWTGWAESWNYRSLSDAPVWKYLVNGQDPGFDHAWARGVFFPPPFYAPAACATKEGTLILWDMVSGYSRFPNATYGTDFSDWMPEQDSNEEEKSPGSYYPVDYCIVANPVTDEVIKFWLGGSNTVAYAVSNDDGVTYGATQYTDAFSTPVSTYPCLNLWVRAAYKANGDLAIVVVTKDCYNPLLCGYLCYIKVRESGVWGNWSKGVQFRCTSNNGENFSDNWCSFANRSLPDYGRRTGLKSLEIAYDGDWMVVYAWENGAGNATQHNGWLVYGDGNSIDKGVWFSGTGEINISSAYEKINSFSDIHHVGATGTSTLVGCNSQGLHKYNYFERASRVFSQWQGRMHSGDFGVHYGIQKEMGYMPDLTTNNLLQSIINEGGVQTTRDHLGNYHIVNVEEIYAYNTIFKIPGGALLWCVQADDKLYFFRLRGDMTVREAVFSRAYSMECKFPVQIVCTADYLFAISNYKIWMSVIPDEWTKPDAGAGVGSACTMPSGDRVMEIGEVVDGDSPSTFVIELNNGDGYFDSPGSGNLAYMKRGSLLSLSAGFNISGVDTTVECRRYFIHDWDMVRRDNYSGIRITCIDGWGLLDDYLITSEVTWNEFENEYSSYDIIEMFVNSIGGTLHDIGCSADIKNNYPFLSIPSGAKAGSVVRKLLYQTSDVIRWFGNDAYIKRALSTDGASYSYQFPKSS